MGCIMSLVKPIEQIIFDKYSHTGPGDTLSKCQKHLQKLISKNMHIKTVKYLGNVSKARSAR